MIRPFNGNVFLLGKYYKEVFPESEFEVMEDGEISKKVNKINYYVNLLPLATRHVGIDEETKKKSIINEDVDFLTLCVESEEIDMFQAKSLQELILFKWDTFAFTWHFTLWAIHMIYICSLFAFTFHVYVNPMKEKEA